jgi:hypothetical protein
MKKGAPVVRKAAAAANRPAIAPLVPTMWHQYLPFSYNCPYDKNAGRNVAPGCVALTMAQLMYYYKYPKATTITIPAYTTYSGFNMPALPPTTFDYSKMKLNYDYIYDASTIDPNDPAIIEVTKLLIYAGCAVEMEYSSFGSAAVFDIGLFAKYLGYDKGARRLMAGNYPHDTWEEMVYNELAAGRPVPYSAGAVGNQSHQFIIDGYDGKGYFHANIGEIGRGDSNIFYKLGVLNDCENQTGFVEFSGYNVGQAAIFGFQPDKGNDPVPVVSVNYGEYKLSKADFTRNSSSADFKDIVLSATMTRHDNNGKSMDYGWGLFQNGVMKKVLCTATSSQQTIGLDKSFSITSDMAEGTYQLFPIFRNHGAKEWEEYLEYRYTTEDGTPMRHYIATIGKTSLKIGVSSTDPKITINKVEYYAAYEGKKLNARAFFTNGGTNYENLLTFWIDGKLRTGVGTYVDPGQSGYVDFCTAAPQKGSHNVKIATDYEGKDVVFSGKLNITEAPNSKLTAEATIKGLKNNVVTDNLDVTLKITNIGTTTFDNMIHATMPANKLDDNGNSIDDIDNGYPTWYWGRVWYLHIEPGQSTDISVSIGNEVFKPKHYRYDIRFFDDSSNLLYVSDSFTYEDTSSNGIETKIQKTPDNDIYYDLQGRRVSASDLKRGVYIHNNKKILVK